MAFRFSKRIKIAPGVTINISKSGISTSLGVRGAHVTYGHGKKRTTIGIPGTGISSTEIEKLDDDNTSAGSNSFISALALLFALIFAVFWLFF